ncbi:ribosome hibernation-promoting factor, HPF/YfiA family [Pseudothermotoga thermarum]|uniref:Sigma 54 modulation protein/ribosomal protein S30EA n=1 Tax=Pseudothermotoga thermarum DSM 5069 TaxID=688269 RepID=F7YV88_9THEM|nr:ribosome-associated translation inhibitor RaiA [Pseudothermotoga thermarum]AEH50388.1 sigma 54 modulation protein/ribosomal protein S30EA [Pseudothermotoga thermarum DSM 5069]
MNYRFVTRGFDSSPAIEHYLEKRLEKVDRVLTDEEVISAEIKAEKDAVNYVLKANLNLKGNTIIVQEKDPDIYAAIDRLCDALEKRVKKLKSSMRDRGRTTSQREVVSQHSEDILEVESEESLEIAETKRIPLNIMSLEEALLQFKTMNRQFFVFRNSETNELNLLYLKKDGKVGLIEFVD